MAAVAAPLPRRLPVSAHRPDGQSMATRAPGRSRCRSISSCSTCSPGGRRWPMPKMASTQRWGWRGSGGSGSSCRPSQSAWRQWASVKGRWVWYGRQRRTASPARCSSRATTRPSPPLWPGPTKTTIPPAVSRCQAGCFNTFNRRLLMASPAFSIRASTGSPLAKSVFSRSSSWAPVTSKWLASRSGHGAETIPTTTRGLHP